jgi:hypothetical protein
MRSIIPSSRPGRRQSSEFGLAEQLVAEVTKLLSVAHNGYGYSWIA